MELDDTAWNDILELWRQPRITRPKIHTKTQDCPLEIQNEIAAYTLKERQIHVNLEKLVQEFGAESERLHAVIAHEVGHHALIPYSPAMSLRLTSAAQKVVNNWKLAQYIENIFDDAVLNTFIVENSAQIGTDLIDTYACQKTLGKDDFGKLYLRMYERLWNLPSGRLIPQTNNPKIESDANTLALLLRSNTYDSRTWPTTITNFARVLEPYIRSQPNTREPRKASYYGDIKEALQEIANELTIDELRQLVSGLGLGTPSFADKQFYLGKAETHTLQLPTIETTAGELYPATPRIWLPSDPVSRLNVPYSLQHFGTLIPGVTSRQWGTEQGKQYVIEKDTPYLFIILDSSGSMPNAAKQLSYPALSSIIAAQSAIRAGMKTAAINFSGQDQFAATSFTYDSDNILSTLLLHFGGGTYFPTKEFHSTIQSTDRPAHILMVSDGIVENTDLWMDAMLEATKTCTGTLFLSGVPHAYTEQLEKAGYRVHPMSTQEDLLRATASTTKELYG